MQLQTKTSRQRRLIGTIAQQEQRLGWYLVLPSAVIILVLIVYPIIYNVFLSAFSFSYAGKRSFAGFDNYIGILGDPEFRSSLGTTSMYVVLTTMGTTLLGIGTALALNKEFPLRGLVRSIVLLPYVAPVISVVFAWQFVFDPVNGIFMDIFHAKLGWFSERMNIVGDPNTAVWAAIIFSIWKNFPFTYLMILARLQAVDKTLYEAAEVDGASAWQQFKAITLPEIYYVVSALILLRVIWNFNKFDEIYLLSSNVKVLSVYTYLKAFTGSMDFGQGATLAVIQFLILIGFILFYVKKVLKW
ncbi:MAG: sugar ABC transporter permease [Spirochaetota bacterium]|jgi:multiple sugar transport system permease protein|nr:sugar ABC transporter permease [Spirochaetota bacterium]